MQLNIIQGMAAVPKCSVFWLCFLTSLHMTAGNPHRPAITCEAGNFNMGERARVTCHFGVNISNYHFDIVLYPLHSTDTSKAEDVLRCHWTDSTSPECSVRKGFRLDKNLSREVTVTITAVNAAMAGQYACHLIPPADRSSQTCHLTVNDASLVVPSETTAGTNVSTSCDCSPQKEILYGVPASVVVGLSFLFVVSAILHCISFYYIKQIRRNQSTSKTTQDLKKNASNEHQSGHLISTSPSFVINNESDQSEDECDETEPKNNRHAHGKTVDRAMSSLKEDVLTASPEIHQLEQKKDVPRP